MHLYIPSNSILCQEQVSAVCYFADGEFTLSKAEFVPLCTTELELTLVLDSDHQVAETNELNNKYVLDKIAVIDGDDADFCTSKFLLSYL